MSKQIGKLVLLGLAVLSLGSIAQEPARAWWYGYGNGFTAYPYAAYYGYPSYYGYYDYYYAPSYFYSPYYWAY